jgi:hypothetical protein
MKEFGAFEATTINEILSNQITFLDINHYKKQFSNLKKRFDKNPDLLIKINEHILIVEAKHIKETGGAQDKSLLELCNFIAYEEEKFE